MDLMTFLPVYQFTLKRRRKFFSLSFLRGKLTDSQSPVMRQLWIQSNASAKMTEAALRHTRPHRVIANTILLFRKS